ncbi:MAG: 50S ribosomal protein L11 methyltransferase [Gammaproteobacteria bacterium]|nr:50S ribosomal protein L11 methyltransferase [Gammaproteobacteria bacterium]
MPWLQLSVVSAHPEFAEEVMLAHGAASVILVDAADDPVFEPWPGQTPLWRHTRTVGMFPAGHDLDAVETALRTTLPDGDKLPIARSRLEDQEWVRVWLKDWKPLRFGAHLWVSPQEKLAEIDDPQAIVVMLDPGLAFGTGTHPTTALCLDWLAAQDLRGRTVLDYGCGSGILAVAALKLGAASAVGVDIDPQALLATRDNAVANGVGDRMRTYLPEILPAAAYDVVLANILARPLVDLAPRLAPCVKPGGSIVMAGLLTRQADEVRAAYAPFVGFGAGAVRDDWQRLDGTRRQD